MTERHADDRWSKVADLLERAAGLPDTRRAAYLDEACGSDTRLRRHLDVLLAADARARGFLDAPAQHPLHAALDAAQATDPSPGTRIGGCTIVRRIATGGMGSVWEALQEQPRRKVALKIVRTANSTRATEQRFAYEAEILGRLRHPHIAQVYAAGMDPDGRSYLAMEFVEGARHLTQYVRESKLDTHAIVHLFLDVCAGVAHGHEKGVIHRDLKPSNVLVDALGQVKVIDFGVARVLDHDALHLTRTGDIVGTLLYMSPEQLDGDARSVDARSDVYALGTLLYELFAGHTPHEIRGVSITEAARVLRDETVRPLRELVPSLDTELEWIVGKALEKDRERRYATVSELAADLQRFLANDPVLAGPPSRTYRVRKFVRRHRFGVAMAIGFVVLLVGGLVAALVARANAIGLQERAEDAETKSSERALELAGELETNREILALQSSWITAEDLDVTGREVRLASVLDKAVAVLAMTPPKSPKVEVELHRALAYAYNKLNLWTESMEQIEALDGALARGGALDADRLDDVKRMSALNELMTGEAEQALQRIDMALAAHAANVALDALPHAAWKLLRGNALYHLHRLAEAEQELRDGLALLELADKVRTAEGFEGRLLLCRTLRQAARLEDAHRESTKLLEDARQAFPAGHSTVSFIAQEIAKELDELGRRREAIEIYERELADMDVRLGPDAETTCLIAGELAWILIRDREFVRAEALSRRSYAGTLRLRGPDHKLTQTRQSRLGSVLVRCGKAEEGLALIRQVHATRSARLGSHAIDTVEVASELGAELLRARQYEEALGFLRAVHAVYLRSYGHDHPKTLDSANSLGVVSYQLGLFAEAAAVMSEVLDTRTRLLDPASPLVGISLTNVAAALFKTGAYAESECVLRTLHERFARGPSRADLAKLPLPDLMGALLLERNAYDEACAFLIPVIDAVKRAPNMPFALRSQLVLKLARAQAGLGQLELARATASELMADVLTRLGPDDGDRLAAELDQAEFLDHIGDDALASAGFESVLERWKGSPGERARMLRRLAELQREAGDFERAAEYDALERASREK